VTDSTLVRSVAEDAEVAVLSALLTGEEQAAQTVVDMDLRAADFKSPPCATVFGAMLTLAQQRTRIDPMTLAGELEVLNELDAVGGRDFLGWLIDAVPTAANIAYHADLVLTAAKRRGLESELERALYRLRAGSRPGDIADHVRRALDAVGVASSAARFPLLTDRSIEELPALEYLVDGMIPAGSLSALVAPPGSGKSFCALSLCVAVATGGHWMGRRVLRPGPAVLIAAEGSSGIRQRLEACKHALEISGSIDVYFLLQPVNFFDGADARAFAIALKSLPIAPALIVVDTLHRSMEGADENSARDMGRVLAAIDRVRMSTGAAVQVIHHTNYTGDKERGSTSLRGAVDVLLQLRVEDGRTTMTCEKQKDAAPFPAIGLELVPTLESCVVQVLSGGRESEAGTLSPRDSKALKELSLIAGSDGATATEWLKSSAPLSDAGFYRARNALIGAGYVIERKKGNGKRYLLSDSGRYAINSQDSQVLSGYSQVSVPLNSQHSHPPLGVRAVRVPAGESESELDLGVRA
jgi:hypothetical protein